MFTEAEQSQFTDSVRPKVLALVNEVERLTKMVKLLQEERRLEKLKQYGSGSERLSDAQLALLDEEPGVSAEEIAAEGGLVHAERDLPLEEESKEGVNGEKRRGRRGARSLPEGLPQEVIKFNCTKEQRICPCCKKPKSLIGIAESKRLHRIPAQYVVRVYQQEKLACGACRSGITVAKGPAFIIAKGIATDELVVDTILGKFEMHAPLYRQQVQMERECGAIVPRSDLSNWTLSAGFLLESVSRAMISELKAGTYIQADETPVGVQDREKPGRNHRGYLWEYSSPNGPVVFDYQNGRSREGPSKMLKGFRGTLQTDGYQAYDKVGGPGIIRAACMAHARRKFHDAWMMSKSDERLLEILRLIRSLYQVEREARKGGLSIEARLALRQEKSKAPMALLKEKILAMRSSELPQSLSSKACDYALSLWARLEVYLEHGEVEIDSNLAENAIRPIALGRKNWLHFGSKEAGPKIAALLSVIETCHRLRISAREYLLDVLPKLAHGMQSEVASLTPHRWAQSRIQAAA